MAEEERKTQPYERQPGETPKAWLAFQTFRDAGPGREVVGTYRTLYGRPQVTNVPGFFRTWQKDHRWEERAEAWDRFVDDQRRANLLDDHLARDLLHVQALRDVMDKMLQALAKKPLKEVTMRDILQGIELVIDKERLIAGDATERTEIRGGIEHLVMSGFIPMPILEEIAAAPPAKALEVLEERMGDRPEIRALLSPPGDKA